MSYTLRYYQQDCVDAVISHIKNSYAPIVADLSTGAGKSLIIAEIARIVHHLSMGKAILCLAPSAELVVQNREKYKLTGNPSSIFSASAGDKSLKHPVVFGTPLTVLNGIKKFSKNFAMVIIDEAHGITPTIQKIIEIMRENNPNLRVFGLTATPFRLGSGYIYNIDLNGRALSDEKYFTKLIYKIGAHELIEKGFLTRPIIGQIGQYHYDTIAMELDKKGNFKKEDVDRAYHGQGRKTAQIVADIIGHAQKRKGVIIFGATVQHAKEIMESLPKEISAIVTGDTPKDEREKILKNFKAQKIKYIVNVAVLTTGFDATHIDVVALMRATESVGLLQQIIGRGLRLHDQKEDCLILDYAENIDRHCPDGDLFNPMIREKSTSQSESEIECECPECGKINIFKARPNKDGFKIDKYGYFIDLFGKRLPDETPAHMGRRCQHFVGARMDVQCAYRWTFKECPHCKEENDIAARYCCKCKKEIIDPNEKLRLEFKALKKDPTQIQIDEVLRCKCIPTMSQKGNPCYRVEFSTPYRNFTIWLQQNPKSQKAFGELHLFNAHRNNMQTVTYRKLSNGFYEVLNYNQPVQSIDK